MVNAPFVAMVQKFQMKNEQFIKHYVLTDKQSGQTNEYLQIIQVELPKAEKIKILFPPSNDFTVTEWWISILRNSSKFTPDLVMELYDKQKIMPEEIYHALNRLDLT